MAKLILNPAGIIFLIFIILIIVGGLITFCVNSKVPPHEDWHEYDHDAYL